MQAWYADDDAAGGTLPALSQYWSDIQSAGPDFGYFPNSKKTVLLVKPEFLQEAEHLFSTSGIIIRTDGNRHLGGVVGSSAYWDSFMTRRVESWRRDRVSLADMASTQPQAAYSVFTKGYSSKWLHQLRCSPCSPALLAPADGTINSSLIPALLAVGVPSGSTERELLSLPARHGGLALPVLAKLASSEYSTSVVITEPLVRLLLTGHYGMDPIDNRPLTLGEDEGDSTVHPPVPESVSALLPSSSQPTQPSIPASVSALPPSSLQSVQPSVPESVLALPPSSSQPIQPSARVNPISSAVRAVRIVARASKAAKNVAAVGVKEEIRLALSPEQRFLLEIASEKGVSTWLTAYPRWQDGSVMKKSDFRDALCIRYG